MNKKTVQQEFNLKADKLVSMNEYRARLNKAYKEGLTFSEKLRLRFLDKPKNIFIGLDIILRAASDEDQDALNAVKGMYTDPDTEEMYAKGSSVQYFINMKLSESANSAYSKKLTKMSVQCFRACKDYSKSDIGKKMMDAF